MFLLTLPTHLEHRITAIRESRDLNEVSLERLYGVLKTYELEQIQQKEIYGMGRVVSTSTGLVAEVPQKLEEKIVQSSGTNKDAIIAEYGVTSTSEYDGDFFSLEELEQLEDESMAIIVKKFGHFRFRRNPDFKLKSNYNRVQGSGSSTSNSQRGGYKTGMVDRGQIRCSNCNEMGHFPTECKMQGQMKKDTGKAYLAIRESRDLNEVSLERLYGVLKTYELEQIQQKEIYGMGRVVSTSTGLVAEVPQKLEEKIVQSSSTNKDAIIAEYGVTSISESDGDFFSLEELEQLEDESMAIIVKKFEHFRFRRNPDFKLKSNYNRVQGSGSSTSNSQRGGYKTGMVDRGQIRCSNCNEMGHFATECKMQGQMKKDTGKAYLAVEKSWDDSDSDDEEDGNLALMAISDNSSSSKPQV